MGKTISSEDLERAERLLKGRALATTNPKQLNAAIAERAGMTADLTNTFVSNLYDHSKSKYFPGIDPRIEQYVHVLMRHCLLVGALGSQISRSES
jgi:hypothetical protein